MKEVYTVNLIEGRLYDLHVYVREDDCEVAEFLHELQPQDKKAIWATMRRIAQEGKVLGPDRFKDFKYGARDLSEFKGQQARILAFEDNMDFILLLGFLKKSGPTPANETARALRLREEYLTALGRPS